MKSKNSFVVYQKLFGGHRFDYLLVMRSIFDIKLLSELTLTNIKRLIFTDKLFFLTCDDQFYFYFSLSVIRSIFGKRTIGLVLRADTIANLEGTKFDLVKYIMLRILKYFNNIKSLSIIPFQSDSATAKICGDWVYDLQFFDIPYIISKNSNKTIGIDFYNLQKISKFFPTIASIGNQSTRKGILFLIDLARYYLSKNILINIIIAGDCSKLDKSILDNAKEAKCIIINREITNSELFFLYDTVDYIWACYDPIYDQSSGIFARAIQLDKKIIIRKNSRIYNLWRTFFSDSECLAVEFNDTECAAKTIHADVMLKHTSHKIKKNLKSHEYEQQFIKTINNFF